MKNICLLRIFPKFLVFVPGLISAQCPITVNAGEDIFVCTAPQQIEFNGAIAGDYLDFGWTPAAGLSLPNNYLNPTTTISQSKKYVLTARYVDESINLVANGDFEQGNTDFETFYTYSPNDLYIKGQYDVLAIPEAANPDFFPCRDHTTGDGNMLAAYAMDGYNYVWCQNIPVVPHTDYKISFWITTLMGTPRRVKINAPVYLKMEVTPESNCVWSETWGFFNSESFTSVNLCIASTTPPPNSPPFAFAIDDISVNPICKVRDTVAVHVVSPVAKATPEYTIPCTGNNITLSGLGSSTGPGFVYQWETADGNIVSGDQTLYPVVNAPGTYTLTVSVANGVGDCPKTATAVVEESNLLQASIVAPQALDCGGNIVLVGQSSQPAFSAYQWTSGPGGNIVSGANNKSAVVNQPGSYTLVVTNTTTGCTAESTVDVNPPALPGANIQPPTPLTDTLLLAAEANPANATPVWTTADGHIASGANTLHPAVTATGMYILTVTNPANGCTAADTVWVSKANDCAISINAGEDIYVCDVPQQFYLNGSVNDEYLDIKWSPTTGLIANLDPLSPLATITNSIQYVLTVRHLDETTNLIQNGDFELGNTDFVSYYDYSPGDLLLPSTYDVLPDPESANPEFPPCNDHTTGSGNMLALNAAGSYATKAWCQSVPVVPFSDYAWSFWVMTLSGTPRTLVLEGASPVKSYITPDTPCVWRKVNMIFNSGNKSTLPLCITSFPPPSNLPPFAFALDDIVLNPICKVTDTVKISLENVVAKAFPDAYVIPCAGKEVMLSGAGSSTGPIYSYNWETPDGNIVSGQNTLYPVVNAPGTYTLSVMLDNGIGDCIETASVEVTESNLLQVSISAPPALNCTPGTPLLGTSTQAGLSSYQWTAGPGGHIVSGHVFPIAYVDQPGEYNLLVTNITNGCTAEASVTIAPPVLPLAVATAPAITCAAPQTTLSGAGSSAGPAFSYAWTAISGHIASGKDSLFAVADTAGTYVLLVTNTGNNCSKTDTVVVTANTAALPVLILPADTLTCLQKTLVLATDSATAGVHSMYTWSAFAGGNIVSGADSLSTVVNAPGMYVLLATDTLNGCTGADTVAVVADNDAVIAIANAPTGLDCTHPSVFLDATGSSPDPNFVYEWSTADGHIVSGGNTASPLVDAPGIYLLQLTNPANGCTAVDAATVELDVSAPDVHLSVSGALHCNTGVVSLLNTTTTDPALLGHEWTLPDGSGIGTGAVPSLDATVPGLYSVLVTNSQNGCTASASIVVEQQGAVTVSLFAQQNNACFGDTNGALHIVAAGGNGTYSYLWSNDATTPAISGLAAGAYTVTVSDDADCTATYSATISQPAELIASASATPPTTFGASDGTATANPQGGTPGYTFAWNTGATDQTISGLPAGFYTVTVTDINNCTAVQTVEVWSGNCNLVADFQKVDPLCHGAANGQATVLPAGGTGPYTYAWSSGSTEQTATGLAAGLYGVTLTDANGCPFAGTVALDEPPLLTLVVQNVIDAVCPNSAEGSVSVLAGGGTGTSAIAWSNGQNGPQATGLPAGEYGATATDANGCAALVTATVNAVDQEAPQIVAVPVDLPIGLSGSMELTLQILGITISDNCDVDTVLLTPDEFDCFDLGVQQVTITATDKSGNSNTQVITVTFIDDEIPVLECPAGISRCADNNIVEYAAPVAIDNCLILGGTFVLVNGLPSGSPFPQGTTSNLYTYTDASGNTGACSFEVTIHSPLIVAVDAIVHDVAEQHIGGIQVSVSGSQPGYSYEWLLNGSVIATTEDLSGIGAGLYRLWVTDAAGCKTEAGPFEVSSLVKTETPDWSDHIAIYPNPASGRVFVVVPAELLGAEIQFRVFDATGKLVLEQNQATQNRMELDLTSHADGLYSILIRLDRGTAVKKIVVDR